MITTRGRYALRVMIDLAEQSAGPDAGKCIPLKDIAERQGVSKKYLEILMRDLVEQGLVKGASGKGGGYRLCRKLEEYPIGEILDLMEGSLSPVSCLTGEQNDCPQKRSCRTLPMWEEYDKMVHDFFYSKKLSDLIQAGESAEEAAP
ncbi:MAG: Rrf2 family transcriptional regulator [Clostridia bacterium]|nr:Rrf2 family transcriptional regulator [Clostridia bacterium]